MENKTKPVEWITMIVAISTLLVGVTTTIINYSLDSKVKVIDASLKEADRNVKTVELRLRQIETDLKSEETRKTKLSSGEFRRQFWEASLEVYNDNFNVEKRVMGNNHRVLEAYFKVIERKIYADREPLKEKKLEMVMTAWADFLLLATNYKEEVNAVWMGYTNYINAHNENAKLLEIHGWNEFCAEHSKVYAWYKEINEQIMNLVRDSAYIIGNDVVVSPYYILVRDKKDPVYVVDYCYDVGTKFGDKTYNMVENPAKYAFEKLCLLNSSDGKFIFVDKGDESTNKIDGSQKSPNVNTKEKK